MADSRATCCSAVPYQYCAGQETSHSRNTRTSPQISRQCQAHQEVAKSWASCCSAALHLREATKVQPHWSSTTWQATDYKFIHVCDGVLAMRPDLACRAHTPTRHGRACRGLRNRTQTLHRLGPGCISCSLHRVSANHGHTSYDTPAWPDLGPRRPAGMSEPACGPSWSLDRADPALHLPAGCSMGSSACKDTIRQSTTPLQDVLGVRGACSGCVIEPAACGPL